MEMGKRTLIFDIDNTIFKTPYGLEDGYATVEPNNNVIDYIKNKYEEGYEITLYTARGSKSGIDFQRRTKYQLKKYEVPYHNLYFGKPDGDLYVDDKAINVLNLNPPIKHAFKVDKTWGTEYLLWKVEDKYAMKRLEINPGSKLSKQFHKTKHETMHVVEGKGFAVIDGEFRTIKVGDTLIFPPGMVHQIIASNDCFKLVIIEASTTELDDIVRLEG